MTVSNPSRRSRQWPRESAVSLWSIRAGMRAISAAEATNDTALIQYATCGPAAPASSPPRTGPIAQLTFSRLCSSPFAAASSSAGTRLGTPANTAGRKNPLARPATTARTTIVAGRAVNGSAQKTPARIRSAATISLRRSSRSISGPSVSPTTSVGSQAATRTPPTQRPEFVRSLMSIASAIAARSVPTLEPRVARASRRKPA